MTNVLSALVLFLRNNPAVNELAEQRIYEAELPRKENQYMPRKAVVISPAGGFVFTRDLPLVTPRFDTWSYGENFYEAHRLDRAVYDALKSITRVVSNKVLLHSVALAGGPNQYRDPNTDWPAMIRSISVSADERTIA